MPGLVAQVTRGARLLSRFLAGLAFAVRNPLTKAARSRVRYRLTLVAAIAGLVGPLAAVLPATVAPKEGTAPPDMVTQWNLTMIAGLEAAAIPPPPSARIGAIVQASVFDAVNAIPNGPRQGEET